MSNAAREEQLKMLIHMLDDRISQLIKRVDVLETKVTALEQGTVDWGTLKIGEGDNA